ncbi:MAG TPA: pyrophosphatase [Parvibaculum sp.]|jgi:NTP pyrophosphatase (non-canonical NTP hydrolase)
MVFQDQEKAHEALIELADRFEEASKAYAETNGIARNDDWFILKMQEELGELTQVWIKLTDRGRARGRTQADLSSDLADETADLLGHILLFARRNGIDLAPAIKRKWRRWTPDQSGGYGHMGLALRDAGCARSSG